MSDWMIWLGLAAILAILEMWTGTFYLLMIAIGMMAGAMAALFGQSLAMQLLVAAGIGVAATAILRKSGLGRHRRVDASSDPNVHLDVGQILHIDTWLERDGVAFARVDYRGAPWDVELAPEEIARPGAFVIREIRGSRLIVSANNNLKGKHGNRSR